MKNQIKIAVVALGILLTANAKAQGVQSVTETPSFLAKSYEKNYVSEDSFILRVYLGKKQGSVGFKDLVLLGQSPKQGNPVAVCFFFTQ